MAQAQRRWTIESGDEGSGSGKSDENLVKTREKRVRNVVKQNNNYYVDMYGCYANDATIPIAVCLDRMMKNLLRAGR